MTAIASPLPEALERDLLSIMGLESLAAPAIRARPEAIPRRRFVVSMDPQAGAPERRHLPMRALMSSRAASASLGVAAVVAALGIGTALLLDRPTLSGGGEASAPPVAGRTVAAVPEAVALRPEPARERPPTVVASRPSNRAEVRPERAVTEAPQPRVAGRSRPAERVRVAGLTARPTLRRPLAGRGPAPNAARARPQPASAAFVNNRAQPETLQLARGPQPAPAAPGYVNNPAQPETLVLGNVAARSAPPQPLSRAAEDPARRERRESVDALMTLRRQW